MIPLWVSKVASRVDLLLPQPDNKQSPSSCTCRSNLIPKGLFRCLVSSSERFTVSWSFCWSWRAHANTLTR